MSGDIQIDSVEIKEVYAAVDGDSSMGYDYFDISLPEDIKKDDIYYVNISRSESGVPSGAIPIRFRVVALNESGDAVEEGEYVIGGFSNMAKALHNEKVFDKDVALSQFVRVEIGKTPAAGSKTLRLYCTRNASNQLVVCQETDGATTTNISVPAIEINEVGLYKLVPWKYTFAENNATWVMPMISRFQIEANNVRGNYPGESIKDAVDGFSRTEDARYTNTGRELFDSDAGSVWQTNQNTQVQGSKYCIDILLPELGSSNDQAKINGVLSNYQGGKLLENGKINLVVQFSRPRSGNVNFPMEVRYCGSTSEEPGFTEQDWQTMILPLPDTEGDVLFSVQVDPTWRRVRFESIEGSSQAATSTNHSFGLSEIRAYLEFPKIDLDVFDYDVLYNDRLFDFEKDDRASGLERY
ncbi:MAG: hypothetical protein K2K97_08610, partial [Muribaculaceae bacterium]|nr:hypothetical protein [Muribaculaceae bacterium]